MERIGWRRIYSLRADVLPLPASCERAPPIPEGEESDGWFAMPDLGKAWAQEVEAWFHGGAEGDAPVSALANWATSVYAHLLPFTGSTAVKIADARSDWTASARIRTQLPVLMDAPFNGTTLITRQTASGVSSGNTRYWPFSVAAREPEGRQSFSAIVPISAF